MQRPHKAAFRASRAAILAVAAFALTLLAGCGGGTAADYDVSGATGADFYQPDEVWVPWSDAWGIDTSGVSDGWVSAAAESGSRLKFQVRHGDVVYNYDMPNDGSNTIFPINSGNGSYTFRIMKNTEGNSYVEMESAYSYVWMPDDLAPFLIPSQICNYTADSACVAKARELTASAENVAQAAGIICSYVADQISYDKSKAAELSGASGYIPNPDDTFKTRKGICFDYASLAAAMLRSMGLPTQIITGYVGEDQIYHAWIMIYIDGSWETAVFYIEPNEWSRCDVTFASTGATQYTGSGNEYTDRYTY